MIAVIFAYFTTIFVVSKLSELKRSKFMPFPTLDINRNGISFISNKTHRLKVGNVKLLKIGDILFVKKNSEMINIHNITNVRQIENFIYFKAKGEVKIVFNTGKIYRYFNIMIKSKKFSLSGLKQQALKDILNNLFNIENSKKLNCYLNFVANVLNIKIDNKRIMISKNKYNLNYELIYKINGFIKHVKVEEIL